MKYVIFSDIHSNLEAFKKVIDDFPKGEDVKLMCCGDTVGYGADPEACIEKIIELDPVCVMGNHDAASVGLRDVSNFNTQAKEAVRWTRGMLTERYAAYLKNLHMIFDNENFYVTHGSLNDPDEFEYIITGSDAMRSFEKMDKRICFVGHTHVAGAFMINKGRIKSAYRKSIKLARDAKYIINVGSVGQPRDNDNRACYCIYNDISDTIEFRRIKYDIKKAQDKIVDAGLPSRLAERLALGM